MPRQPRLVRRQRCSEISRRPSPAPEWPRPIMQRCYIKRPQTLLFADWRRLSTAIPFAGVIFCTRASTVAANSTWTARANHRLEEADQADASPISRKVCASTRARQCGRRRGFPRDSISPIRSLAPSAAAGGLTPSRRRHPGWRKGRLVCGWVRAPRGTDTICVRLRLAPSASWVDATATQTTDACKGSLVQPPASPVGGRRRRDRSADCSLADGTVHHAHMPRSTSSFALSMFTPPACVACAWSGSRCARATRANLQRRLAPLFRRHAHTSRSPGRRFCGIFRAWCRSGVSDAATRAGDVGLVTVHYTIRRQAACTCTVDVFTLIFTRIPRS